MKYFWFGLKNCLVFKGRTNRKEFWVFSLLWTVFTLLLVYIDCLFEITSYLANALDTVVLGLIFWFFCVFMMMPLISVTVRRLHDIGMSGWYCFVSIIPYIGFPTLLFFMFKKGDEGTNQYGESSL